MDVVEIMNDAAHLLDPEGRNSHAGKNAFLSRKAQRMIDKMNPRNWRCPKCGRKPEFASEDWRYGVTWEHHHGYPLGYISAERISHDI